MKERRNRDTNDDENELFEGYEEIWGPLKVPFHQQRPKGVTVDHEHKLQLESQVRKLNKRINRINRLRDKKAKK